MSANIAACGSPRCLASHLANSHDLRRLQRTRRDVAARDEFEVEYEPVHGDTAVFLHDPFYAFPGGREPHEQHELPRPFLGATLEPLRLLRDVAGVPGP